MGAGPAFRSGLCALRLSAGSGRPPDRAVHQPLPDHRHGGRADPLAGVRSQYRALGHVSPATWLQEGSTFAGARAAAAGQDEAGDAAGGLRRADARRTRTTAATAQRQEGGRNVAIIGAEHALSRSCWRSPRSTRLGRPTPQSYPSRPVTIIVSLAAGTGMDTLVRVYGEKLSQSLGQPVVIENKPGGAGVVAGETIAKGARRRLHAGGGDQRDHGDPTDAVQAAAVQSADRLHPDLELREVAVRVHRQSGAAGQLGSGVHQICEGAAGTDQLQLVRGRRRAAPDDGIAQAEVRLRHGARAVPEQPAIHRRRRRRPRGGGRSPRPAPRCR